MICPKLCTESIKSVRYILYWKYILYTKIIPRTNVNSVKFIIYVYQYLHHRYNKPMVQLIAPPVYCALQLHLDGSSAVGSPISLRVYRTIGVYIGITLYYKKMYVVCLLSSEGSAPWFLAAALMTWGIHGIIIWRGARVYRTVEEKLLYSTRPSL